MKNNTHNYLKLLVLMLLFQVTVGATAPRKIDTSLITAQPLQRADQEWFCKEFVHGFMSVYKSETFFITQDGAPKLLGPKDIQEKEKWLQHAAQEEFSEYVGEGKEGYQALKIKYGKKIIGAILYRVQPDEEHTIYLGQLFIHPDFQNQGIGMHVIAKLLPALHPLTKRYEVLTRHQNGAAFRLYCNKLGFKVGDIVLVQKYEYNPLFYIGFYKVLQK